MTDAQRDELGIAKENVAQTKMLLKDVQCDFEVAVGALEAKLLEIAASGEA